MMVCIVADTRKVWTANSFKEKLHAQDITANTAGKMPAQAQGRERQISRCDRKIEGKQGEQDLSEKRFYNNDEGIDRVYIAGRFA